MLHWSPVLGVETNNIFSPPTKVRGSVSKGFFMNDPSDVTPLSKVRIMRVSKFTHIPLLTYSFQFSTRE